MDSFYAEIGRKMRSVRKALKLTQAELAEAAGIDSSFYGQIERGANIPSLKTFLALARALKVEPADLLPGAGKQSGGLYDAAMKRLVQDLDPKKKRLVLGMISDIVGRLKE